MGSGRGYRGWMAAITVALTLTLVFLAVEKHLHVPAERDRQELALPSFNAPTGSEPSQGILLTVDPGLVRTQQLPQADPLDLARRQGQTLEIQSAGLLRRPPDPAANVVLQAPIVSLETDNLPLHASQSNIHYLMESLDRALESPISTASVQKPQIRESLRSTNTRPTTALMAPASLAGRLPNPQRLRDELSALKEQVQPLTRIPVYARRPQGQSGLPLQAMPHQAMPRQEAQAVVTWILHSEHVLDRLITSHGLEHASSAIDLLELSNLVAHASQLASATSDHNISVNLLRAGYSLQRRVLLWQAIQACLDGTSIGLIRPQTHVLVIRELRETISAIENRLGETGDAADWQDYLMLNELREWADSNQDIWDSPSRLPVQVASRLRSRHLTSAQQRFLAEPEFQQLAGLLSSWGQEAIDYRQLLVHLERFELQPTSRANQNVASAVQLLRYSDQANQRQLAQVINDHYRNANMRLAISADLIQRFLPKSDHEIRPVRQRILGAETSGDSAIRTELTIKLIPDPAAWRVDLGVLGDMVSMTSSSKGPAVFHNTSTAQINSHRYLRIDPQGYRVSSEPTGVDSQDYLRKMSTDFDRWPIVGDFVRLIVREQFEQKRGLAQRVTRRMIAQEADAELDRRLEQGLTDAERRLSERIIGPLEDFSLNPIVVSMNTTEERLMVRYRVANESQMAAFTPRPRAPSDALLSLQFHQSMINNTIDQIGLIGRTWTLPELYSKLGRVFQQSDWQLPEDVPQDITIRFDDQHPAIVELKNGRLRLSLRVAELHQDQRLHIERFVVHQDYIPVADGLNAELLRDGVVEIECTNRDRFRLRVIFASIFVANAKIPLVADSWQADPRAQGLAVSQMDVCDGWLSLAISNAASEHAAEVAQRSQSLNWE